MAASSSSLNSLRRGVWVGSTIMFFSTIGATLTYPFLQIHRDSIGCDPLCFSSQQSARSALTLLGSFWSGRLSDTIGRTPVLWMGLISSIFSFILWSLNGDSILGMWIGLIPMALLNHTHAILKALYADYASEPGSGSSNALTASDADRTSAMGRLGAAVGFAIMIGPMMSSHLLFSFRQAVTVAAAFQLLAGLFIFLLPPTLHHGDSTATSAVSSSPAPTSKPSPSPLAALRAAFTLPVARLAGARLLFFMRLCMTLAFHAFFAIWSDSLRDRFAFTPRQQAYLMGFVGLMYALSQGWLAKRVMNFSRVLNRLLGNLEESDAVVDASSPSPHHNLDTTPVLLMCAVILSFGRVISFYTTTLWVLYAVMGIVIVALGVMNTAISAACSRLADPSQAGGLFGALESIENLAGIVGPVFGGWLYRRLGSSTVLLVVIALYSLVFASVFLFYRRHIVQFDRSALELESSGSTSTQSADSNDISSSSDSSSTFVPPALQKMKSMSMKLKKKK